MTSFNLEWLPEDLLPFIFCFNPSVALHCALGATCSQFRRIVQDRKHLSTTDSVEVNPFDSPKKITQSPLTPESFVAIVARCPGLESLVLHGFSGNKACAAALGGLTNIRRLAISGWVLTDEELRRAVCGLPNLEVFDFHEMAALLQASSASCFPSLPEGLAKGCPHLREVRLPPIGARSIKCMASLRDLSALVVPSGIEGLDFLAGRCPLTRLSVGQVESTDLSLLAPQLRALRLRGTVLSDHMGALAAGGCVALESLTLGPPSVFGESVMAGRLAVLLAQCAHCLRSLQLHLPKEPHIEPLLETLKGLPCLAELSVTAGDPELIQTLLEAIPSFPALRLLRATTRNRETAAIRSALQFSLRGDSALRTLDLGEAGAEVVAIELPHLERLTLSASSLRHCALGCPLLEVLRLCPSHPEVKPVLELACPDLRKIDLGADIGALRTDDMRCLRKAAAALLGPELLAQLAAHAPQLDTLAVGALSFETLTGLLAVLPQLRVLRAGLAGPPPEDAVLQVPGSLAALALSMPPPVPEANPRAPVKLAGLTVEGPRLAELTVEPGGCLGALTLRCPAMQTLRVVAPRLAALTLLPPAIVDSLTLAAPCLGRASLDGLLAQLGPTLRSLELWLPEPPPGARGPADEATSRLALGLAALEKATLHGRRLTHLELACPALWRVALDLCALRELALADTAALQTIVYQCTPNLRKLTLARPVPLMTGRGLLPAPPDADPDGGAAAFPWNLRRPDQHHPWSPALQPRKKQRNPPPAG
ncbi:hypothetical protein PAPYR_1864 [Paratrimastix pyriformis]|uniref:F-box domain-containing protein n=1 Tax=Paratrimastix pyriformis TaxID=342808 RepID=A0ABQ8UUI8_9EUKA|nr:hypothetical protein PAPYR_1864 [Paratrimastix pyriformis]